MQKTVRAQIRPVKKKPPPSFLVSVAIFNFSILSSSASCECVFSRVGWMVANRRAAITADNADKRQTLCNQLPQKRRLLEVP